MKRIGCFATLPFPEERVIKTFYFTLIYIEMRPAPISHSLHKKSEKAATCKFFDVSAIGTPREAFFPKEKFFTG